MKNESKQKLNQIDLFSANLNNYIKLAESYKNSIRTPYQMSQTDILLLALMIQIESKSF